MSMQIYFLNITHLSLDFCVFRQILQKAQNAPKHALSTAPENNEETQQILIP